MITFILSLIILVEFFWIKWLLRQNKRLKRQIKFNEEFEHKVKVGMYQDFKKMYKDQTDRLTKL